MNNLLIFILIFCSLRVHADPNTGGGVYVGNGGEAVICNSPLPPPIGGEEVLVLDFWMSLVGAPMQPVAAEVQRFEKLQSFKDAVDFFDEKLARVPWFQNLVKQAALKIKIDQDSFVQGPLAAAKDSALPFPLPEGCHKAQVALRRAERVFIDIDIYKKMNQAQRAVLYMHEYIYAAGVFNYGHNSSVRTQSLMIYLLQSNPSKQDLEQYLTDHFTVRP